MDERKCKLRCLFLICLGAGMLVSLFTNAAEFKQYSNGDKKGTCPGLRTIAMTGDIAPGDFLRLYHMLPAAQRAGNATDDEVQRISFDSSGGDYFEAVKIAHLLRGLMIQSYVEAKADCQGACAIAFMGGTGGGMEGYSPPDRRFVKGAKIVLRTPSFTDLGQRPDAKPVDIADEARQQALQLFVSIMQLASEHEWSQATLDKLIAGGPETSIDMTNGKVAKSNKLFVGRDCKPYTEW